MTVIRKPALWLLLGLLLPMWSPALADEPRDAAVEIDPEAPQGLVFRGKPLPLAHSFVITEFGITTHDLDDSRFTWEMGWMKNLNRRFAVGAAMNFVWASGGRYGGRFIAAKARLRYWPQRLFSIDLAPGIILGGRNDWGNINTPSFTGHVGVGFADWISGIVELRHDNLTRERSGGVVKERDEVLLYFGLKFGSYPGAVLGAAGGVLAFLVHGYSYGD